MSDLTNWFNLQHLWIQPPYLLQSQLLRLYSFGVIWRILQERKIPPSPFSSFGGAMQTFINCCYKWLWTTSVQFSRTGFVQGMPIGWTLFLPPIPTKQSIQTFGPHVGQFAGLRPQSINRNETNQNKKKITLSACLVTKSRVVSSKRMQISHLHCGLLNKHWKKKPQMLGSHPFSFKHN